MSGSWSVKNGHVKGGFYSSSADPHQHAPKFGSKWQKRALVVCNDRYQALFCINIPRTLTNK